MALRDILHTLSRPVAFGEKLTSSGGQDWLAQSRMRPQKGRSRPNLIGFENWRRP
jgi:hypothetical protein